MRSWWLALLVVFAVPAFAASPSHPNEPGGYQVIAESPVDALPSSNAAGTTPLGWTGLWWGDPSGNYYIGSEASAPESPSGVFTSRIPNNLPAGTSPGQDALVGWSNRPESSVSDQYQSLYFTYWIRINGTQFYQNNNGMKISYFGVGRSPGTSAGNEGILILEGTGSQHYYDTAFKVHYYLGGHINPAVQISQLSGTGKMITVGNWHQIEVQNTLNTLGQSNGVLRVWIDGTLVIDRNNVVYITSGNTAGFWGWKWEPTWGGGLTSHIGVDYLEIDHVYLSGIPLGGSALTCGNGQLDSGEQCDQGSANGACPAACSASCTTNTCTPNPVCGNTIIEGTEQCDGSNLNGSSCASLGYTGGVLSCSGGCQFVTSACTNAAGPVVLTASPEGTVDAATTTLTTTITTNMAATCAWNSASGLAWGSLSPFTSTGGTTHSRTFSATLIAGNTYTRYIRCRNSALVEGPEYVYQFTAVQQQKIGDLNGDGVVNIVDIQLVLAKLGTAGTTREDLNNDHIVNIFDLVVLAQQWG